MYSLKHKVEVGETLVFPTSQYKNLIPFSKTVDGIVIELNRLHGFGFCTTFENFLLYVNSFDAYLEVIALNSGATNLLDTEFVSVFANELDDALWINEHFPNRAYYSHNLQDVNLNEKHKLIFCESEAVHGFEKLLSPTVKLASQQLNSDNPLYIQNTIDFIKHINGGVWEFRHVAKEPTPSSGNALIENETNLTDRERSELQLIRDLGYEGDFLFVKDLVNFMKNSGIRYNARGSVSNSALAYRLGFSCVDAERLNLPFSRFVNEERAKRPDIDLDIDSSRLREIWEYLSFSYGKERIARLTVYNKRGLSNAIELLLSVTNNNPKITTALQRFKTKHKRIGLKSLKSDAEWLDFADKYPNVSQAVELLSEGYAHKSQHTSGIIVDKETLDSYFTVSKNGDGKLNVVEASEVSVNLLGFHKFDILSSKALEFLEALKKESNKEVEMNDDIFSLFELGKTEGIFQFESKMMKDTLMLLKPKGVYELVIVSAINRPGPAAYIDLYLSDGVKYDNTTIQSILSDTKGIILFQEQVIQILSALEGISDGEADNKRRWLANADENEVKPYFRELYNKTPKFEGKNIFFKMLHDMRLYAFPKGHAYSYALISYEMAWYKKKAAGVFFSQYLERNNDNKEPLFENLKENVSFKAPHYSRSFNDDISEQSISIGAKHIEINDTYALKQIMEALKPDWSIERVLLEHCIKLNTKDVEKLIFAGYFDTKEITRKALIDTANFYKNSFINTSFEGKDYETFGLREVKRNSDEYNERFLIEKEREVLGFYINEPLYSFMAKEVQATKIRELQPYKKDLQIVVEIESLRLVNTKKREQMVFLKGKDDTGEIDIVVFPKTLELFRNELARGYFCLIKGSTELRQGKIQFIANEISKR